MYFLIDSLSAITHILSTMWRTASRLIIFCFLLVVSSAVQSQAGIRDASSANNTDSNASGTTEVSASERAATLVFQVQALQEEVATLRGLIEEQQHEIKRLKQQRLEDYLDLDKRLTDLTTTELPLTGNDTVTATPEAVDETSEATGTTVEAQADDGSELYSQAIDQLLNQQNYESAQAAFSSYIEQYPSGTYAPNAYYWQGQILSTQGQTKSAETLFKQLIAEFPDHNKAPDAKFKLAKIYFDQDKKSEAKVLLEEVVASGSDAAILAESFLSKNY